MKPYDAIPNPGELKLRPRLPTFRDETVESLIKWGMGKSKQLRAWMFTRLLEYNKAGFPICHQTEALACLDLLQWQTGAKNMKGAVAQLEDWARTETEMKSVAE